MLPFWLSWVLPAALAFFLVAEIGMKFFHTRIESPSGHRPIPPQLIQHTFPKNFASI
jgi:hypothetical protein